MEEEKVTQPTGAENTEVKQPEGGESKTQTPESGNDELKSFTQEELNALIIGAKKQVKKKYEAMLSEYEELKRKAAEYEAKQKEEELAKLSEVERLQKLLEEKEAAAAAALKEKEEALAAIQREKIETAFERAAAKANIPDKYLEDAKLLAGLSKVESAEEVEELVKKLVKEKPFLVEKKEQKPIGQPSNPAPTKSEKDAQQVLKELAEKARRTGRIEDRVKYAQKKKELGL